MAPAKKYGHLRSAVTWRMEKKKRKRFLASFIGTKKDSLENSIELLVRSGDIANAGMEAIQKQHEKGFSATIKIGNDIYRVFPDGKKVKIATINIEPVKIKENILQIPQ